MASKQKKGPAKKKLAMTDKGKILIRGKTRGARYDEIIDAASRGQAVKKKKKK